MNDHETRSTEDVVPANDDDTDRNDPVSVLPRNDFAMEDHWTSSNYASSNYSSYLSDGDGVYDDDNDDDECEDGGSNYEDSLADQDEAHHEEEEDIAADEVVDLRKSVGNNQDAIMIMSLVNSLAEKAAVVMVSDPVPQYLGNITPEEYKKIKTKEARKFKKGTKLGESWGKHAIHDTIAVQLGMDGGSNEEESDVFEANDRLKEILVPHHSVHIPTEEERQREQQQKSLVVAEEKTKQLPTLPRPPQSILHRPVTCPSRLAEEVNQKRRISFNNVTVREYVMIMGDHPNCRYGPPVTISWDYLEYEPVSLNEYEGHHSRRRPLRKLYLFVPQRKQICLDQGHTMKEVKDAKRACKLAQWQRTKTSYFSLLWRLEDMFESICRKLRRKMMVSTNAV